MSVCEVGQMSSIQMPEWAGFLFQPSRYKVAYGGRGSGKSWAFAMGLLIEGAQSPHRILCAREVQKSIKESVHNLLSAQIVAMGLENFYEVLETEIRGKNGTTFSFAGLSQHTVASIKSFEGVTRCWIEEAQSVSKRSWDVLLPTIRRTGSEIWVTLNPEMDTDETYLRFIVNKPPNCASVEVNFDQNPWFNEVLEQERAYCKLTAPDDYDTIWEGKCRAAVVGAIYAREMDAANRDGRVCFLPHDPKLKTHVVFDLGWNDSMVVAFVQRHLSSIRIIDAIKDSHRILDTYAQEILDRKYRIGKVFLPHDGFHKDYKTGKSAEEMLRRFFPKKRQIVQVPSMSIEAGIKAARATLAMTAFDKVKAESITDALKRYRRAINSRTEEPGSPLHDDASHGADVYRYVAICADQMTNEDEVKVDSITPFEPLDAEMGF
jgi:phage terminase large subunit